MAKPSWRWVADRSTRCSQATRSALYYQQQGQFTKAATGLFPGTPGAFAFDEPALAQAVADALNAMKADGTYDKLMDAYGTTKMDVWDRWPGEFTYFYTGE